MFIGLHDKAASGGMIWIGPTITGKIDAPWTSDFSATVTQWASSVQSRQAPKTICGAAPRCMTETASRM